ncbi:MAG: shikimate dehydrogenase, partial [Chloroflexi bacterium]|nr:shikimate dehydrogenase [Chloroflexota bacterium]
MTYQVRLLGHPVDHSLSPAMHNAAFRAIGMDALYAAQDVAPERLGEAVEALRADAYLGANVTVPHKQDVLELMDELTEESLAVGAVNTIVRGSDGRLTGSNTDARGLENWLRSAAAGQPLTGASTLVLGGGGAARAAVMALGRRGARSVLVLNRTPARALAIVADLQPGLPDVALDWGRLESAALPVQEPVAVAINATSLGLSGQAPPLDPSWLGPQAWAIDLVYNPLDTPFLAAA